jgi:drug/metabolite transporter (DMT)-like permease
MYTTVRYVGAYFSVALVLWTRYGLHAAIMTLWIVLSKQRSFRSANPMFQIARGALLAFSSAMAFAALRRMPVAEFTAIVMLTPVVATLVARVWLKELISPLRWALVIGGFIGALIVIRPGSGIVGWAALLPLAAAFSNAAFQIMTSRFAPHEDPFTTNFYTGATGMAIATPILLASVTDPMHTLMSAPGTQVAALIGVAVLGTTGHLMLIMGLSKAPASTLMPFQYAQMAVAALAGYIVFGVVPDGWGWIGMAIIGVCGAASAWLNVRVAAEKPRPVSTVQADTIAEGHRRRAAVRPVAPAAGPELPVERGPNVRLHEAPGRRDHALRLVAMRRVPAIGQLEPFALRHSARDAVDLLQRAVFVVEPLHGEQRAADRLDFAFDRPLPERRMQPDAVPAPERRIGIVVVAGQAFAQVGLQIVDAHPLDAGDRDVLDEDVRRQHDRAGDLLRETRREQQRDRRAVAVAEQPGGVARAVDIDRVKERRQHFVRLAVQEIDVPPFVGFARRRAAVTWP